MRTSVSAFAVGRRTTAWSVQKRVLKSRRVSFAMPVKEGDIVFARVTGYGFWPGQVMDPKKANKEVRKNHKPNNILVAFFGDNSYGSFKPENKLIVDFVKYMADTKGNPAGNRTSFQKKNKPGLRQVRSPNLNFCYFVGAS